MRGRIRSDLVVDAMTEFDPNKPVVSLGGAQPAPLVGGVMVSRTHNRGWSRELWRLPTEEEMYAVYTYKWAKRLFSTVGHLAGPFTPGEILDNYPEFGAYRKED